MTETASPAPDTSSETHHDFGWALGTLLRAYHKQAQIEVAELPGGPRAYHVMSIVSKESCLSQAAIAERLGLDRTTMTYLLDGLDAQDLVKRTPDPGDRRARHVALTVKGCALLEKLHARVHAIERRILYGLGETDTDQFRLLLTRAAQLVDSGGGSDKLHPCHEAQLGDGCNGVEECGNG